MPADDRAARLLVRLLASAGVAHFAVPGAFDRIVPRWLPGRARTWTEVSGAVELLLAAGIAIPRTRRASAYASGAYFAAVFPANVQMAYDWRHRSAPLKALAYGRLPLQAPLMWWARQVARGAGRPEGGRVGQGDSACRLPHAIDPVSSGQECHMPRSE